MQPGHSHYVCTMEPPGVELGTTTMAYERLHAFRHGEPKPCHWLLMSSVLICETKKLHYRIFILLKIANGILYKSSQERFHSDKIQR